MQRLLSEICVTARSERQSTDCVGSTHASASAVAQTLPRKPDSSSGPHPG